MSTTLNLDQGKLDKALEPVKVVLSSDLEKLRRKDELKRVELWNSIEGNQNTFEDELMAGLPADLREHYASQFTLARLLLATAAYANGEESPIVANFNDKELTLAQDFERYNVFDILSADEIRERIARRDELFTLVREIYEKQYADVDTFLDAPEVQRDLKRAFKRRYEKRLENIKEGVKAYVGKYGPVFMVRQIEEKIWQKVKESERERERVSADMRRRLEELVGRLKPLERAEGENRALKEKLLTFERAILEGSSPDLTPLQSEKERLFQSLLALEGELSAQVEEISRERKGLEERKEELERLAEGYRQQAEEERERIIQSELGELEKIRSELLSQEQSLEDEKTELHARRAEMEERLRQLREIAEGKPLRWLAAEDARLAELNFISRFEEKMHRFPLKVFSPIESKTYTVNSWEEGSHRRMSEAVTDPTKPSNESCRYVVSERKYKFFGPKLPRVIIEAISFSHLREFGECGFDVRRANLGDFLGIITRHIKSAEISQWLHILGLASPTGWDERVAGEISSDSFARNYLSRYVSVCLVDSITGEVFYNSLDKRIANFIDHFKPEFKVETIARLKKGLEEKLALKGYVAFEEFAKGVGEPRNLVLKAFYDLEKEGQGRVKFIQDVGLVLKEV
jgi:hypothetical protein